MNKEEFVKLISECRDLSNKLASNIYKVEEEMRKNGEKTDAISNFSQASTEMFYYFMSLYLSNKK